MMQPNTPSRRPAYQVFHTDAIQPRSHAIYSKHSKSTCCRSSRRASGSNSARKSAVGRVSARRPARVRRVVCFDAVARVLTLVLGTDIAVDSVLVDCNDDARSEARHSPGSPPSEANAPARSFISAGGVATPESCKPLFALGCELV